MKGFEELSKEFMERFDTNHFPAHPSSLYEPATYFLGMGGKRIRPVMCLMGNELFDQITPDAWEVSVAIELFHNFSLIHDDIMDQAPLRRGMPTVHEKYGTSTALLSGDVMLVVAYDYINKIGSSYLHKIIHIFNRMAMKVCEGQQMDMNFEKTDNVSLANYLEMIELKTSVLMASSLQMGAIIGGAGDRNCQLIYEFGKNLGLAFQVQDDYLDAFGDPVKFGKQVGGDIVANKKTFLLIKTLESANPAQLSELKELIRTNPSDKVSRVLKIFSACGVDAWAKDLKEEYFNQAMKHFEDIAVLSRRKEPLLELSRFLLQRDY
jgi:geranylgeranyl diphosphate synthase, type II